MRTHTSPLNRPYNEPARCQLCKGELQPWLDMPIDPLKNAPTEFHRVMRCAQCGSGLIYPQPTEAQVKEFYDVPVYYTHGEGHIKSPTPSFWDKVLTKLAWTVDRSTPFKPDDFVDLLPAGGRILDLGCGHAYILQRFQELNFNVLGVDPDPTSREEAAAVGVKVLAGTAEMLPPELEGQQFDLVIMTHALEHCLGPRAALLNAFRLTKDGGYFYCEVPNCECTHFETLNVCSAMFDAPRHLWFFTATGLRRAIEASGFTFDSWRWAGFTRHHSPGWRNWEKTIYDRLARVKSVPSGNRHTYFRSLSILAKSAIAPSHRKFDCVGIVGKKSLKTTPIRSLRDSH